MKLKNGNGRTEEKLTAATVYPLLFSQTEVRGQKRHHADVAETRQFSATRNPLHAIRCYIVRALWPFRYNKSFGAPTELRYTVLDYELSTRAF